MWWKYSFYFLYILITWLLSILRSRIKHSFVQINWNRGLKGSGWGVYVEGTLRRHLTRFYHRNYAEEGGGIVTVHPLRENRHSEDGFLTRSAHSKLAFICFLVFFSPFRRNLPHPPQRYSTYRVFSASPSFSLNPLLLFLLLFRDLFHRRAVLLYNETLYLATLSSVPSNLPAQYCLQSSLFRNRASPTTNFRFATIVKIKEI